MGSKILIPFIFGFFLFVEGENIAELEPHHEHHIRQYHNHYVGVDEHDHHHEEHVCNEEDVHCSSNMRVEKISYLQMLDSWPPWFNALLGTALITCGGNTVILFFMYGKEMSGETLNTMTSFAVGGLLGDAFLHLLPHASSAHSHSSHTHSDVHSYNQSENHSHNHKITSEVGNSLCVLAGIFSFFLIEKFLRSRAAGHVLFHSKSKGPKFKKNVPGRRNFSVFDVRPGAILNMIGDTVHNFTDGLAIGASFAQSTRLGCVTTLAVLLHEIPHEVGDYAILLQQGFSRRSALLAQFVSALGAFAGCGVGVFMSQESPAWVLCFTAGGFIYVSLVNVIPELLQNAGFWQTVRETVAISTGISLMILIVFLE
eukprot:g6380.t1